MTLYCFIGTPELPGGRVRRGLTDRAEAAGRAPAGASTLPCGTTWLAHKRTHPLKAGPVSFKRLLGRAIPEPPLNGPDRGQASLRENQQIGRASCRERV